MADTTTIFEWRYNNGIWQAFPKCPSTWNLSYQQIVTESKRTVGKGALLHKDLLAEKAKYTLSWYWLTPYEYDQLHRIFRGHNFFQIRYHESENFLDSTGWVTRTMYGGDMAGDAMRVDPNSGIIKGYLNVSWNLIER